MQVTITVNDPAILRALADLMEGKLPSTTAKATPAKPAVKPAKGKKAVEVVEEDEDEVSFEDDEEETEVEEDESEDEVSFEDDEEETEVEEDEEMEEEEEVKPSKNKSKPAAKPVASKKTAPASSAKAVPSKIKYEEVQAAFRATHSKLEKKLKSKEKAVAKLNGLLKKFGAKSTRALDTTKYGAVLKELKALAA